MRSNVSARFAAVLVAIVASAAASLMLATPAQAGSTAPSTATSSDSVSPSPDRPITTAVTDNNPVPLVWRILGTSCVNRLVNADIEVTGAITGHRYTLVGTSGYPASQTVTASATSFETTFVLSKSWQSFLGDLQSTNAEQTSKVQSIGAACAATSGVNAPVVKSPTPVVAPSTTALVTTTETDGLAAPASSPTTSATTTIAPATLSTTPAAASHTSGKSSGYGTMVLLLALILAGALGTGAWFKFGRTRRS